ncbi:MAG: ABC transporter permease [Candidatus Eisenbacteria bacterium]|nr:ABC transporter permease [Candidatus Eisenbacteria bacterium]
MEILRRIVRKEFLQLRFDKQMLRILFIGPIFQLFALGFAANNDVLEIPTVLVDLDRSRASRALLDRFLASDRFQLVEQLDALAEVDPWLRTGRAQIALVIGAGFGAATASGATGGSTPGEVQILVDGTDSNSAVVGMSYATAIVSNQAERLLRTRGAVRSTGSAGSLDLRSRVWYNPDLKSRWFYLPVILALTLLLNTLILPSMGVVREKEIGTLEQILVTPIRPWQLIVGKLLPFALIGIVNICAVTALIVFFFRVPLVGSFPLLVLLSLPLLLTNLSLGLLVSTLVRTQQQAMMTSIFAVMIPMIYLSGLIFPIENMPRAIQFVTYAIPLRYYNTILRGIFLKGSGIDVLWPQTLTLLGFGIGILTLAARRFRKNLD